MRLTRGLGFTNLTLMMLWAAACSATSPLVPARDAAPSGKISPALLNAVRQSQGGVNLPANGSVRSDAQGRIQIYVYVTNTSADTISALASHGLKNMEPSATMNVVQGWISPSAMVTLAALPSVIRITPPRHAIPR